MMRYRYRRLTPAEVLLETIALLLVGLFFFGPWAISALDFLFSSYLTPQMPQFMWGFWGIVIGSVAGLHLIAPRMGLERAAQISRWAVPSSMLILALAGVLLKHM